MELRCIGMVEKESTIILLPLGPDSCLENPMDGGAWWATVQSLICTTAFAAAKRREDRKEQAVIRQKET